MKIATATVMMVMVMFLIMGAYAETGIDSAPLKEGDIIFQETRSFQAKAIKLGTHSRYTHVGIVLADKGKLAVLEAVHPVKITGLDRFIKRGIKGHYVVKRIKDRDRLMTAEALGRLRRIGMSMIGKKYDLYFEWDDRRIYCTELVWKMYKGALNIEVGKLQKLRDFDLANPFVKYMMFKRYGTKIPYDEPVISPQAMYDSENLETVAEGNCLTATDDQG